MACGGGCAGRGRAGVVRERGARFRPRWESCCAVARMGAERLEAVAGAGVMLISWELHGSDSSAVGCGLSRFGGSGDCRSNAG